MKQRVPRVTSIVPTLPASARWTGCGEETSVSHIANTYTCQDLCRQTNHDIPCRSLKTKCWCKQHRQKAIFPRNALKYFFWFKSYVHELWRDLLTETNCSHWLPGTLDALFLTGFQEEVPIILTLGEFSVRIDAVKFVQIESVQMDWLSNW